MPRVLKINVPSKLKSFVSRTSIKEVVSRTYSARLVSSAAELEQVLRLRYEVFQRELGSPTSEPDGIDFDEYDLNCEHIAVYENSTGKVVGTYRLNAIESAGDALGFYASTEFCTETLPPEILERSVELGRACIAKGHRNTRVLFMLWRVLANYLTETKKRYLFGCCSVFTQDGNTAGNIFHQLNEDGYIHKSISVKPRLDKICIPNNFIPDKKAKTKLPPLVNIYLRIGAKICGEPAIDRDFKTIDFFVIFDLETISKKYLKLFFG